MCSSAARAREGVEWVKLGVCRMAKRTAQRVEADRSCKLGCYGRFGEMAKS